MKTYHKKLLKEIMWKLKMAGFQYPRTGRLHSWFKMFLSEKPRGTRLRRGEDEYVFLLKKRRDPTTKLVKVCYYKSTIILRVI